jgi:ATP-dependent Clp protease, protease subunit
VNFFSQINDVTANKFMAACAEIIRVDNPQCIHFLFASPGGNVDAGIAVYNYLRALPIKIIMHNTGAIDSIANVIFHAADERYANSHSTFLFMVWDEFRKKHSQSFSIAGDVKSTQCS